MIAIKSNPDRLPVPPPPHPENSASDKPFSAAVAKRLDQPAKPKPPKTEPPEDAIPPIVRLTAEERKAAWVKNPPKVAATVAAKKADKPKAKTAAKPKGKATGAKKAPKAPKVAKTEKNEPKATPAPKADGPRPGSKAEMVMKLLQRENGCTAAEVLFVTNWPAVSMPAAAKAAGLKLRKEKENGKPTRYYGS